MKIVQLLITLQKGDAIGNYTLIIHELLKKRGYNARIYAQNLGPGITQKGIKKIDHIKDINENDLIIYHMCEANVLNSELMHLKCKKIAVYHNVTPPEYFLRYGTFMWQRQKNALYEVELLRNTFNYCIAVSDYNRNDLIKMGYDEKKVQTIPVILAYEDFRKTPDAEVLKKYADADSIDMLFVGRIAPNKKQEDIIRMFAYYKKKINNKSRLFLIGSPFNNDYWEDIKTYIEVLGLQNDIIMPGHISFEQILAFYSIADIFVCMSEHEGFGVPLIEAMLFHKPVIAYNSSAIEYTLNGSGVLLNDKDPCVFAKEVDRIMKDDGYKRHIITLQNDRLNELNPEKIEDELMKVIQTVIGESE